MQSVDVQAFNSQGFLLVLFPYSDGHVTCSIKKNGSVDLSKNISAGSH